ncbi:imidazole glycerol phosphate synthase subunit HisH [Nocardioides dubius]|uniref:imidazole glycerol phosphate synthase subunit HisH n=1 Tax=Nocardioides dubius TaxID=317019 RepID=UPI0039E8633D
MRVSAALVSTPEEVGSARRILLPGVGKFDRGMEGLEQRGLDAAIQEAALGGRPVLGICLGMQLLTKRSEEGQRTGLGLVDVETVRLDDHEGSVTVPHMGWGWVRPVAAHPVLDGLDFPARFYFAHSFAVPADGAATTLAVSRHGSFLSSVIGRENVLGAQFHPEKSHVFGMQFLERFGSWEP